MSSRAETCLMQHLTDAASLRVLAMEGLDLDLIYDETLRPIVAWALEYYHDSGRTKAPSAAAILAETGFGDALSDAEIDLDEEPEDTIEWAIDTLKGLFIKFRFEQFNKKVAREMAEATNVDRPAVLAAAADELISLQISVESKDEAVDVREAMAGRIDAYHHRAANRGVRDGLVLGQGMELIDEYTNGIKPGELAFCVAGPKVGKSFYVDFAALRSWQSGRLVGLYTLENKIDMTLDRIACLAMGVDYRSWQRGTCTEEEVRRVVAWEETMKDSPNPMWVRRPPLEKRRVTSIVRDAQLRGCDDIIIDQLSHIRHADTRLPRHYQIGESLRELADMLSSGRNQMPCLLAHQINREGVESALKRGYYEMTDLAESADAERTADWVFGLHQTRDERAGGFATLQTLASRREDLRHFSLIWRVGTGRIQAVAEKQLG